MKSHTDRQYEADLQRVRDLLAVMGGRVERMVLDALEALQTHDRTIAQAVIASDHEVNDLEGELDETCLRTLALRQPAASDLRFLAAALKVVTDIERMGDLAVNMAERVIELCEVPPLKPYIDLPQMGRIGREMLSEALQAFAQGDVGLARSVIARDNVMDAFYVQILRELLTYMMEDPRNIPRAFKLLNIAKTLERLGDHVTNVAEQVIFLVEGRDVRHQGLGKPEPPEAGVIMRPQRGVLFVCVANAARSQMAEAWARRLAPAGIEVASAGLAPSQVHPLTVQVMAEVGLDIAGARAKTLDEVPLDRFDLVVTLCDEGRCLATPKGAIHLHWPIEDPIPSAASPQALEVFRRVRDDLAARVDRLFREG